MQTLYCYKVNKQTGEITKIVIDEYTINPHHHRGNTYIIDNKVYQINKCDKRIFVPQKKLDKYVSGKVFTFSSDDKIAHKIIFNTLNNKITDYQKQIDYAIDEHNKIHTFLSGRGI